MPAPVVLAALLAALARLWPAILIWFRKWGAALVAFITGLFTAWLKSLSDWVQEELQDFFIKDNPDAEDLRDFVSLMRGKSSKFEGKIQAKLAETQGTLADKRKAAMARFDAVSDSFNQKHPVIWNKSFAAQLRAKLDAALEKAEATFIARIDREAKLVIIKGQKKISDAEAKAGKAVDKADAIRAMRSAKFIGRSDTQVSGYLKTLKAGTATHAYTEEELENEIKGRKLQGKWNPK